MSAAVVHEHLVQESDINARHARRARSTCSQEEEAVEAYRCELLVATERLREANGGSTARPPPPPSAAEAALELDTDTSAVERADAVMGGIAGLSDDLDGTLDALEADLGAIVDRDGGAVGDYDRGDDSSALSLLEDSLVGPTAT